jgi:hypothetical protein
MIGPFVIAAGTMFAVRLISGRPDGGVEKVCQIYATVLAVAGFFVAAALSMGRHDSGQNHSDYGVFIAVLWFVATPPPPVLLVSAVKNRFFPKPPNQALLPTTTSVTAPAGQEPRQP